MFNQSVNERLTEWINFRKNLETAEDPLQQVWDFWHVAPFIPYNKKIDPYYQNSWPSPWEIIADNKYDEFTRALMIAWTLKLTKKFADSKIEIRTLVDTTRYREYNVVYIDDNWVINYSDNGPISAAEITESFKLENLVEVCSPR
jgi:hypothetical protein